VAARTPTGIMKSPLRRCDAHLGFATHQLKALTDRLLAIVLEGPKVVDRSTKLFRFCRVARRQKIRAETLDRTDSRCTCQQPIPERLGGVSQGADQSDPSNY